MEGRKDCIVYLLSSLLSSALQLWNSGHFLSPSDNTPSLPTRSVGSPFSEHSWSTFFRPSSSWNRQFNYLSSYSHIFDWEFFFKGKGYVSFSSLHHQYLPVQEPRLGFVLNGFLNGTEFCSLLLSHRGDIPALLPHGIPGCSMTCSLCLLCLQNLSLVGPQVRVHAIAHSRNGFETHPWAGAMICIS